MFRTSVEIAAPVEDVWAVLVDVERWPEWTASMSEVEVLDGRPFAVGTRVRIKQPKVPAVVWEVTSLEPRRAFGWTASVAGVKTVADHHLRSREPGRVQVTLGLQRSGPLAGLVDLLARRVTRRYLRMEAAGLKRRCESP